MKITKFGHCCLLIEENGLRVLTDPGSYTEKQNEIKNIDVVLITHEHQDHFHVDSVKKILVNNPQAKIITNSAVNALLSKEGIDSVVVEDGQSLEEKGIVFSGHGKEHAIIYKKWNSVENTGYFIGERLFYPGDAFYNPNKPVEILALPVAGPWCKISEAIEYALEIKPKICFPVHDGGLKSPGVAHRAPSTILPEHNIKFLPLEIDKETEF